MSKDEQSTTSSHSWMTHESLKQKGFEEINQAQSKLSYAAMAHQSLRQSARSATPHLYHNIFSVDTKDVTVLDQEETGLCWLYSSISHLEVALRTQNIHMEISPHYYVLFDKLEKSAAYLSQLRILESSEESDYKKHCLHYLLSEDSPYLSDGGNWSMFLHLVKKYGVVHRDDVMLNHQLCHTRAMNREWRNLLRTQHLKSLDSKTTKAILNKVHTLLVRCLGHTIPEHTRYKEDNTTWVQKPVLDFVDHHLSFLFKYSSFVHLPLQKEFLNRHIYSPFVSNDVETMVQHKFIVLEDLQTIKNMIMRALENGITVPFTADVRHFRDSEASLLDVEAFDHLTLLGVDPLKEMDKYNCLQTRLIAPNHAMLFVGMERDAQTNRVAWKVLNSWGSKKGKHAGFLIMSDAWFDKFVFEVTVPNWVTASFEVVPVDETVSRLDIWDVFSTVA